MSARRRAGGEPGPALYEFEVTDLVTGESFVVVQPELLFDDDTEAGA